MQLPQYISLAQGIETATQQVDSAFEASTSCIFVQRLSTLRSSRGYWHFDASSIVIAVSFVTCVAQVDDDLELQHFQFHRVSVEDARRTSLLQCHRSKCLPLTSFQRRSSCHAPGHLLPSSHGLSACRSPKADYRTGSRLCHFFYTAEDASLFLPLRAVESVAMVSRQQLLSSDMFAGCFYQTTCYRLGTSSMRFPPAAATSFVRRWSILPLSATLSARFEHRNIPNSFCVVDDLRLELASHTTKPV
jgi:hypothetical protein